MAPYQYRCTQCRETSPPVGRQELDRIRARHRRVAHGGLIPDGEQVIEEPRVRLVDMPRPQKIACVVLLGFIVFAWATGML
ncbi:hypothetical protein G6541_12265 [Streptomyces albidoflavus]|nr:hypothetical protein [Streptomyces albidoflavus]